MFDLINHRDDLLPWAASSVATSRGRPIITPPSANASSITLCTRTMVATALVSDTDIDQHPVERLQLTKSNQCPYQANAGPLPARAVTASRCFSSRILQRPRVEKMLEVKRIDCSSVLGPHDSTVIPSRIYNHWSNQTKIKGESVHVIFSEKGGRVKSNAAFHSLIFCKRWPIFTLQGVLGMARITVVVGVVQDWSCSIVTPAQILTRSLSFNASWIPGAESTALATWGFVLKVEIQRQN